MKRKIISYFLVASIVFASNLSMAFANDLSKGGLHNQDNIEEQIESINASVDTESVVDEYSESGDKYKAEVAGADVYIAQDGNGEIELDLNGSEDSLNMALPKEVKNSEAIESNDGTILYNDEKADVSIAVQPIEETKDNDTMSSGVRTMVLLKNNSASKSYAFKYNLSDKCSLVFADEFEDVDDGDRGAVFIIKDNAEVIGVIKSPWAKDADGNNIDTYYEIKDNILIQHIEFDKNTKFPVVADPSTIVDTKVVVKKTYKKYLSAYAPGQGVYGTKANRVTPIVKGVFWSKSETFQVESGVTGKKINFKVGYLKSSTTGTSISIVLPKTGHWYKIRYSEYWMLQYKGRQNKYRTIKITNNGKTKKVTYQWVEVSNWVDKYKYLGDEIDYVKTKD